MEKGDKYRGRAEDCNRERAKREHAQGARWHARECGGGVDMHAQVVCLGTDVLVQVFEVLHEPSQRALFGVKHRVSSLFLRMRTCTRSIFSCV